MSACSATRYNNSKVGSLKRTQLLPHCAENSGFSLLACFWLIAWLALLCMHNRRRRAATQPAPANSGAGTTPSDRLTASAAVQPLSRQRQQSAKPKGKGMSRLARASESPLSSGTDDSSTAGSSREEEDEEQGSSEEEDATSGKQEAGVKSPVRCLSDQHRDDSDNYADDSSQQLAQQGGDDNPQIAASALQQQQRAGNSNAVSVAVGKEAGSMLAAIQLSQQHIEHMHVAVRSRPVPSESSMSCWVIDPSAATITLSGSASAAKRKQALTGSSALRSSNSNGLDGGQSRGLLGTAPSTPGSGFWESNAPAATSMGYRFDQVLDDTAETVAVYSSCIQSLVHSALEGVNGTVLAYGKITPPHTLSVAVRTDNVWLAPLLLQQ